MTIYEIDAQIEDLLSQEVDEETGEINESVYEQLDALQMERGQMIENLACYIKNLRHFAEDLKAEKMELAKRQAAAEGKAERLMKYLQNHLNGEKVQSPKFAITYRKSQAIVIDDEESVMDWLVLSDHEDVIKVEHSIKKDELKKLIKAGEKVNGAWLEDRVNMTVK